MENHAKMWVSNIIKQAFEEQNMYSHHQIALDYMFCIISLKSSVIFSLGLSSVFSWPISYYLSHYVSNTILKKAHMLFLDFRFNNLFY